MMNKNSHLYSTFDKEKIRKLSQATGASKECCRNYLTKYNFDYSAAFLELALAQLQMKKHRSY